MIENDLPDSPASGQPDLSEMQQLRRALESGAITPQLFATLEQQLRRKGEAPPAPPASAAPATGTDSAELPSLLSLFSAPPAGAAGPAATSPPSPEPPAPSAHAHTERPAPERVPAAEPARPQPPRPIPPAPLMPPAPPPPASSDATQQAIREQLAKLRQPAPAPPVLPPVPQPVPVRPPQPVPVRLPASEPEVATGSDEEPAPVATRNRLPTVLAVLAGLALLLLVVYLATNSRPHEALTSTSKTQAEATAGSEPDAEDSPSEPEPEPEREAALEPAPKPATEAAASAAPPVATQTPESQTAPAVAEAPAAPAEAAPTNPEPAAAAASGPPAAPVPARAEAGDNEATTQVRKVMAAYYADLFEAPLTDAAAHFAPRVERLYIQQNLTPAAIAENLRRTFFPDNKQAMYQIDPGTLRVSGPVADGSYTATFTESVRLFRVSRGRYQRLRTQVRARFDADFRITYLRQEKLLENEFE